MIRKDKIEEVKKRLVNVYDPIEIYIFGSYAWGNPTEDSDLDLCIVVGDASENVYERPFAAYDALFGLNISKDIIVYTEDEFENYSENDLSFAKKIKEKGKKIYAKA